MILCCACTVMSMKKGLASWWEFLQILLTGKLNWLKGRIFSSCLDGFKWGVMLPFWEKYLFSSRLMMQGFLLNSFLYFTFFFLNKSHAIFTNFNFSVSGLVWLRSTSSVTQPANHHLLLICHSPASPSYLQLLYPLTPISRHPKWFRFNKYKFCSSCLLYEDLP